MSRIPCLTTEDMTEAQPHLSALAILMANRHFSASFVGCGTSRRGPCGFGYQMVIELVGVTGFYSLVALTLNAFESDVTQSYPAATLKRSS